MSVIKIIVNGIIIIGALLSIYMLAELFYNKIKLKKGKIESVNNTKYVVIMMVLIILFIAYGILRNFIS